MFGCLIMGFIVGFVACRILVHMEEEGLIL